MNTDFEKEAADFEPGSTVGSDVIDKAQHLKGTPTSSKDSTPYDSNNLQHRQHTRHLFTSSLPETSQVVAESANNTHTSPAFDTFASEVTINLPPPPPDSMEGVSEELTHIPGESDFASVLVAMEKETDPLHIPNAEQDISALRKTFENTVRVCNLCLLYTSPSPRD